MCKLEVSHLTFSFLCSCNDTISEMIDLNDDDSKPAWRMFVVATAIGISLVLQALLFHLTFHLSMTLGLRVKAALTAAVFSKVFDKSCY